MQFNKTINETILFSAFQLVVILTYIFFSKKLELVFRRKVLFNNDETNEFLNFILSLNEDNEWEGLYNILKLKLNVCRQFKKTLTEDYEMAGKLTVLKLNLILLIDIYESIVVKLSFY